MRILLLIKLSVLSLAMSLSLSSVAAPTSKFSEFFSADGIEVTPETYPIAESARQIIRAQSALGVNVMVHRRDLTPTAQQPVVRMNRDTYYSMAVVDVSGGATITLPEVPAGKYISMQPVTEDHRIQPMSYGGGSYELATHYGSHVFVIVRLDSTFSKSEAAFYQDQIRISAAKASLFTTEPVDKASFERAENELKSRLPGLVARYGEAMGRSMFTAPTDESREFFVREIYEVASAAGWGGAQWKDNIYEISGGFSANQCHQVSFDDPHNTAFWSITVYDGNGFMFNDLASMNSHTAKANADGSITVSFGCGKGAPNNIPTENGSGVVNLTARHYQPSDRIREQGHRILSSLQPK
ncbi:DUF1214 domain-containing protein [Congregibacter variabilis]|uniref:DUF1214 domain-containing protein n=1 Tax=Congregibacter variabilis TaxID=3081200 RepID=A0ABZ0I1D4_9GAMM|nr:DUF1214 domain-containing protein [Congregibacter sp. IMCC43200]